MTSHFTTKSSPRRFVGHAFSVLGAFGCLLVGATPAHAQMTPYFQEGFIYGNPISGNWTQNGTMSTVINAGLTSTSANGGSLISALTPPVTPNDYEVASTIRLPVSGGNFVTYLRATTDAVLGPTSSGTYYAVELVNPTWAPPQLWATLEVKKRVGGVITVLGSKVINCQDGFVIRSIIRGNRIIVYSSTTILQFDITDSSITTGKPGVGVRQTPSGNGISWGQLYQLDTVPPNPVTSISSTAYPTSVTLSWPAVTDNAGGSGLWYYQVERNGLLFSTTTNTQITDTTVVPQTTYTYKVYSVDQHMSVAAPATKVVTTPSSGVFDPSRRGVRPNGTYWGAGSEQLDMLSGNLNFSLPLLTAQGRAGLAVPFNLSYNSQLWRKEPGGTFKLGQDVGYGFGWKLMAGSITPVWSDPYTLDHYRFTDATGAEYRLNVNNGAGVWRSKESIYLYYDSNTYRLYNTSGTFWQMDCVSLGQEPDVGTRYPTVFQSSNGNQILVRYQAGIGSPGAPSSARITEIEDVRAVQQGGAGPYRTYTFSYDTDPTLPHLTGISNHISTPEAYTFSIGAGQALSSPFTPQIAFGSTRLLGSVTSVLNHTHTFEYGTNNSGELTKVTLPSGGYLRWVYQDITYPGGATLREVASRRTALGAGQPEDTYTLTYQTGSSPTHYRTYLDSPTGARKHWAFFSGTGDARTGLLGYYEDMTGPAGAVPHRQDYNWTQYDTENPYIASVNISLEYGTGNQKMSRRAQTLDAYGNVTYSAIYDYADFWTPVRWNNYTYLTGSLYPSRYIFNRLTSATVTDSTGTRQLVTNSYDEQPETQLPGPDLRQFQLAGFNPYDVKKGNLTRSVQPNRTLFWSYDGTGTVYASTDGFGHAVNVTPDNTHNYAAPKKVTPNTENNLATNFSYNAALAPTQTTGPNAATQQFTYDSNGRPQMSVNAHGGVSSHVFTVNPMTETVTTGLRWTKTTQDGFGRPKKVEIGANAVTESIVDTEYAACACSPLGKVKRVSQPYAPGQTPVWTTYTYDALGRTTRVDLPDGSFTTTSYLANVTTVTDPAGKWKKYATDTMGNLTKVEEPNPAGGANLETSYVYDYLDRLKTVTQVRSGVTQTRTFTYNSQQQLQSVNHPESGTTSYTYNTDGTVATKTDAKAQRVDYVYDAYQRVSQIKRFPAPPTEDVCQRTLLYYDTNPFNAGDYSGSRWGRLSAAQWFVPANGSCASGGHRFTELYDYSVGGLVVKKRLYVKLNDTNWPNAIADLGVLRELNYSYDGGGLGLLVGMTYPSGTGQQLTYVYDSMQRLVQLNNTGANPLVQGITYGPGNEMKTLQHLGWVLGGTGNYYQEQRQYNNRLQLTRITGNFIPPAYATPANGIDVEYRYTAAQNNGQISQQKDWISGEEITYQYDSLTRLISAATTGPEWGLSFAYDGFGNRTSQTVTKGSGPSSALTYNTLNRINGFNYDNNGNITWMTSGVTLTYDVDNRSTTMQGGFGTERYGYDPRNQRVYRKKADGTEEFTLWGARSERIETFRIVSGAAQTQTTNIYFAGRLMRTKDHTTGNETALVTNRVGSVAVRVNPSGINEKLRYYPYGEEYTATTNDRDKFATYFRDSSTGLDYAINRYYGNNLGRFLSPDQGSPLPANPGSWNRYTYSWNDPINYNDPGGLLPAMVVIDGSLAPWISAGGEVGASSFGDSFLSFLYGAAPGVPRAERAVTPLERHMARNELLQLQGYEAIRNLGSGCRSALNEKGINIDSLLDAAVQMDYYDVRFEGHYSVESVSGAQSIADLRYLVRDARAAILYDREGKMTNKVVLSIAFFTDRENYPTLKAAQDTDLRHELLHFGTKLNDVDLANKLGLGDLSETDASRAINRWLMNDCEKK